MAPYPIAETSRLLLPSLRFCMLPLRACRPESYLVYVDVRPAFWSSCMEATTTFEGTIRSVGQWRTGGTEMNTAMRRFRIIGAVALMCVPMQGALAQTATSRLVTAAKSFLSSLDAQQRARVLFSFDDDKQRVRWSNFPNRIFQRAGLSLGELNATQRSAAMAVVAAALSRKGYEKILQIMEADEVLKASERNNPMFGKDLYFV